MINYAILVGDEYNELSKLLEHLYISIDMSLIKVVQDFNKQSNINYNKIDKLLTSFDIDVYGNYLQSFAKQRNFLLQKCVQDYVFWIDADEIPDTILLQSLPKILLDNPTVDILWIPRENYLINDTDKDIPNDIGPAPAKDGTIGWPDYQGRIHKRLPNIKWGGNAFNGIIHETLTSENTNIAYLPAQKHWSLLHIKKVSEQIKRKQFYDSLKETNLL